METALIASWGLVLMVLMALGSLVLVVLVAVAVIYNGFVRRRRAVQMAFATIEVQLKKRWDLVPDLVETVKGHETQETEVFEAVMRARRGVELAETGTRERFEHEQDLGAGVARILVLAEAYPELTASGHFQNLQRSWTEIEQQLSATRRTFNAAVTRWNAGVESSPGSLMAKVAGFQVADWFETPSDQRKARDIRL